MGGSDSGAAFAGIKSLGSSADGFTTQIGLAANAQSETAFASEIESLVAAKKDLAAEDGKAIMPHDLVHKIPCDASKMIQLS